jgi:SAM-dependent methyltransferase/uncharacterized protein YbaR (Trm112 family)
MHRQLPAILKCTYCGCEGLRLVEEKKIALLNEVETVISGAVKCLNCGSSYPVQDGIVNFLPVRVKGIGLGQRSNHNRLVAWGYERYWRPRALSWLGGRNWPLEEELATVVTMLAAPEPERLTIHNNIAFYLDQGCSTGFYGRGIARAIKQGQLKTGVAEGHVVAIDNSWQMLQETRKYLIKEGLEGQVSLVRGSVEQAPFIEQAFVAIADGGSLNEYRHTAPALTETYRVLSRHGQAAFMVQMHARNKVGSAITDLLHLTSGIHFFTAEQLAQAFEKAGLRVAEQQGSGLITISLLKT